MSFSPVGSPFKNAVQFSPPGPSMTISPIGLGDIMVVAIVNDYGTFSSSLSVSGGGVTTWTQLNLYNDGSLTSNAVIFWGIVTSTGSSLLSIGSSGGYVSAIAQEFSVSGVVSNDTVNGATSLATSGNYPSVTPTNTGELYLGTLFGDPPLGGSSAGFTYIAGASAPFGGIIQQLVYSTTATGATSPPWSSGTTTNVPGRFLCTGFLAESSAPANQIIMVL